MNGFNMLVVDYVVSNWLWMLFICKVLNKFVKYVGMVVKLLLYIVKIIIVVM